MQSRVTSMDRLTCVKRRSVNLCQKKGRSRKIAPVCSVTAIQFSPISDPHNPPRNLHLAEEHKVVYISGLGDELAVAQDHARKVSSFIYNTSARETCRVDLICNESGLRSISNKQMQRIQEYIVDWEGKVGTFDETGIAIVFICHSLGAKVFAKAMKPSYLSLEGFTQEALHKVKKHLIVLTLGGVVAVPESLGKVVKNYRFRSDWKSKWAFICCNNLGYLRSPKYEVIYKTNPHKNARSSDTSCFAESCFTCRRSPHTMDDYLNSRDIVDDMLKTVGKSYRW